MLADGLREIGALAFLFIPLDLWWGVAARPGIWKVALWTTLVGGGTFALGVAIERIRPVEGDNSWR
jgi:hypothetical protein